MKKILGLLILLMFISCEPIEFVEQPSLMEQLGKEVKTIQDGFVDGYNDTSTTNKGYLERLGKEVKTIKKDFEKGYNE